MCTGRIAFFFLIAEVGSFDAKFKSIDFAFYYYLIIGKNVFQLVYKCIQQNLFWKHQCQRETPKEDKILWIVLCSKHTMFEQRSNQFGVYGSLHLLCFKCN